MCQRAQRRCCPSTSHGSHPATPHCDIRQRRLSGFQASRSGRSGRAGDAQPSLIPRVAHRNARDSRSARASARRLGAPRDSMRTVRVCRSHVVSPICTTAAITYTTTLKKIAKIDVHQTVKLCSEAHSACRELFKYVNFVSAYLILAWLQFQRRWPDTATVHRASI